MKTSVWVTIISIVVTLLLAISGFVLRQSDQLSRHDVRIENLEDNYDEVKEMRKDISAIKETLSWVARSLDRKLKENP